MARFPRWLLVLFALEFLLVLLGLALYLQTGNLLTLIVPVLLGSGLSSAGFLRWARQRRNPALVCTQCKARNAVGSTNCGSCGLPLMA